MTSKRVSIGKRGEAKKRAKEVLFAAQAGRCCYCRVSIELYPPPWGPDGVTPKNFATLEHLRRKADGGDDSFDNLALACFDCNTKRDRMNWVEFATARLDNVY